MAEGKRFARLATSGAFHSPLMADAADGLDAYLANVTFAEPSVPLICNTDAARFALPTRASTWCATSRTTFSKASKRLWRRAKPRSWRWASAAC